jgi:hypothetical protein
VFFRAETLPAAGTMIAAMFGGYGAIPERLPFLLQTSGVDVLFLVGAAAAILLAAPFWPGICKSVVQKSCAGRILADVCALAALLVCILNLVIGAYNPFIYFRF